MSGIRRAGNIALAAVAGLATGVLAWQLIQRGRRSLAQRRADRALPAVPGTPALRAVHDDEARLDEGIEESFPASDPVSIRIE